MGSFALVHSTRLHEKEGTSVVTKTQGAAHGDGLSAEVAELPAAERRQRAQEPLTVEQRRERGRSLRAKVPRSSHAFWAEPPHRPDPVALLEAQETTREQDLVPIRHARMRVSAFAFFRGSAVVMAEDLSHTPIMRIHAQLCGDAHVSNFGGYASPERTLLFDINDFDETLPGPWEWDVKRLAASVYVAGRSNGFAASECREATLSLVRSYRQRMTQFAGMGYLEIWYSRVTADDLLGVIQDRRMQKRAREVLAKAQQRTSLQALPKLTKIEDGRRVIANAPPLVMRITSDDEGETLHRLFDAYLTTLRGAQRHLLERYQIPAFRRKVGGVASVGRRSFILLLTGRDGDDPLFLQVKEALPSVLEAYLPKSDFAHQGERVVAGQELMQAASDITLGWVRGPAGHDFYVRQLRDMKASAEIEGLSPA